jgi:response regulator RpfG family c-di-GMP phosphodiesterase
MTPNINDPTRLRVLIVDDEPMLRSVIEEFLAMLGYQEPFMASDGNEALRMLRTQAIDCVISDIRMPEMALEEMLPLVNREFPRMIVIATSGYSDFENALNIIDKGAHDFLGKPLNLDSLELALVWVSQRQPILDRVALQFGADSTCLPANLDARFDDIDERLVMNVSPFQDHLRHARRVALLARRLRELFSLEDWRDLVLASMMHEMGSSHIMHSLVDQPRRLDDPELHVVRAHSQISGRLTSNYLCRPEFAAIIGKHLQWGDIPDRNAEKWTREQRLSVWLGLLNYVDGCLRERPDRMPYTTAQVQESLRRRLKSTNLQPIEMLLERWHFIEQAYRKP